MGLTVVTTPTRTVNGIESNLIALKSQIPFEFKRIDIAGKNITQEPNAGPNIKVSYVDGDGSNLEFANVGDSIYLTFAGVYTSGLYLVTSRGYPAAPPNGVVVFNLAYSADTTADLNLITYYNNYNVSVNFFSNITNTVLLANPLRYVPRQAGDLFFDLSGLYFGFQPTGGYSDFSIIYGESFRGVDQATVVLGDFAGLPGKKQFLNDGGANMWEYLPNQQDKRNCNRVNLAGDSTREPIFFIEGGANTFLTGEFVTVNVPPYKVTGIITAHTVDWFKLDASFLGLLVAGSGQNLGTAHRPAGLFLTDFKNPVQWLYYKKQISWFFDTDALVRNGGVSVDLFVEGFDASGISVSTDLVVETTQGLKTYDFPTTAAVSYYEVELRGGPGQANVLSEQLTIKQKPACTNPILIEWQNRQGAMEQYVFSFNQNIDDVTSEGLVTESPTVQTLDLVNTTIQRLPIDNSQQLTLLADSLDKSTFNALKYLKASEQVFVYLDSEGTKKISVAVVGGLSTSSETNTVLNDFRVKVQFPPDFKLENI